jgi:hypothetical protein
MYLAVLRTGKDWAAISKNQRQQFPAYLWKDERILRAGNGRTGILCRKPLGCLSTLRRCIKGDFIDIMRSRPSIFYRCC